MDPARLAIFVICLLLIIHASQKAVKLDKENRDDINKEGEREREGNLESERQFIVSIILFVRCSRTDLLPRHSLSCGWIHHAAGLLLLL